MAYKQEELKPSLKFWRDGAAAIVLATALALGGGVAANATTLTELPGARSEADSSGNVFLGGNYLEVGVSKGGSFGTSAHPSDSANNSTCTAKAFHDYRGYTGLGLQADQDGWNVGESPTLGDIFLPGSPEECWILQYQVGGSTKTFRVADRNGDASGTWTTEPTTVNTSSGDTLSARTTGVTSDGVKITLDYSFGVDDLAYVTNVTVENTGSSDITNARFLRSFDPDQDVQYNGTYETYNKVVCNPVSTEDGSAENYAMVVARGYKSLGGVFFISFDNRARVNCNVDFEPTSVSSSYWESAPVTTKTYAEDSDIALTSDMVSAGTLNGYTKVDDAIHITFNLDTIAAGASTTCDYYTSLDPDVKESLDKIKEKIGVKINYTEEELDGFGGQGTYAITNDTTDKTWTLVIDADSKYVLYEGSGTDGTVLASGDYDESDAGVGVDIQEDWFGSTLTVQKEAQGDTEYEPATVIVPARPGGSSGGSSDSGSTDEGTNNPVEVKKSDVAPTSGTFTIKGVAGQEYTVDGGKTWVAADEDGNAVVTGLEDGKTYRVQTRIAATSHSFATSTTPGVDVDAYNVLQPAQELIDKDTLTDDDVVAGNKLVDRMDEVLKDFADGMSDDEKKNIETARDELKAKLEFHDIMNGTDDDDLDSDGVKDLIDRIDDLLDNDGLTDDQKHDLEQKKNELEQKKDALDEYESIKGDAAKTPLSTDDIDDIVGRIEDLLDNDNLTDDQKKELEDLKGQLEDQRQAITDAQDKYKELVEEGGRTHFTIDDIDDITDQIDDLLKNDNLTDDQKKELEKIKQDLADKKDALEEIDSIKKDAVADPLTTGDIDDIVKRIDTLLDGDDLNDDEKAELEKLKSDLNTKKDVLNEIDSIKKDAAADPLTTDDITKLVDRIDDLLNGGNLTDDQKTELEKLRQELETKQDELDALDELDSIKKHADDSSNTTTQIDDLLKRIEELEKDPNLSDAGKKELEQLKSDLNAKRDVVAEYEAIVEASKNDNLTSDDIAKLLDRIAAIENSDQLNDAQKAELAKIKDELTTKKNVLDTIAGIVDDAKDPKLDTDSDAIDALIKRIDDVLNGTDATPEQKAQLEGIKAQLEAKKSEIADAQKELKDVTDAAAGKGLTEDDIDKLNGRIEALKQNEHLTDAQKDQLKQLEEQLIAKKDAAQEYKNIVEEGANEHPTEDDIKKLEDRIDELVNSGNLSDDQKKVLEQLKDKLDKEKDALVEYEDIQTGSKGENITVDDIDKLLDRIDTLSKNDNLNSDRKDSLDKLKKDLEDKKQDLEDTKAAADALDKLGEDTDDVIGKSDDDLSDLDERIDELMNNDKLTPEQKKVLEDIKNKVDDRKSALGEMEQIKQDAKDDDLSSSAIDDLVARIDELLNGDQLSDAEKAELEQLKADLNAKKAELEKKDDQADQTDQTKTSTSTTTVTTVSAGNESKLPATSDPAGIAGVFAAIGGFVSALGIKRRKR